MSDLDLRVLQEQGEADLAFDLENADSLSIRMSAVRERWVRRAIACELSQKRAEQALKVKYRDLFEHFMVNYSVKIDRRDVDSYIEADAEFQKLQATVEYRKATAKYIDGVLQAVDRSSFHIGNAIKWAIFKAGG